MALVPTKNPAALIGYYLGVGSVIPIIGAVLALPAIICGIIGIVKANSDKQAGGMGHAITAIILGLIGQVIWVVIYIFFGCHPAGARNYARW